jgi:hypothetical protein
MAKYNIHFLLCFGLLPEAGILVLCHAKKQYKLVSTVEK